MLALENGELTINAWKHRGLSDHRIFWHVATLLCSRKKRVPAWPYHSLAQMASVSVWGFSVQ